MKTLVLIILMPVFALAWELPPDLELVERDSLYITVRDINTGEVESYYCSYGSVGPGEPAESPGWEMPGLPITADLTDSCFEFVHFANLPAIQRIVFGDSDRDSLIEIVGMYGAYDYFYEFSGHDSTYILQDTLTGVSNIDYGQDTDNDGFLEFLLNTDTGIVIYESADSFSLPTNYVFTWPNRAVSRRGGMFDLDGDGQLEISLRASLRTIEVLRNIGDNDYELDYTVSIPDSFDGNFYDYVSADFDNDGKNELLTTSSNRWVVGYENTDVIQDSFEVVWFDQVSRRNGRWVIGPFDLDRDQQLEFIVMAASVSRGGYFFYIYECMADNYFEQVYVDSLPGNAWDGGSIEVYDIEGDGSNELIVCSHYSVGIYKSFGNNAFELVYLYEDSAWEVFTNDTNANGFAEIIHFHAVDGIDFMEYSPLYIHGDVNIDCALNLQDPLYLVNYFKGRGNPLPEDIYIADTNGDCIVNGMDVTYFVAYFKGGDDLIDANCE